MKTHPHHGALRDAVAKAGDNQSLFARGIGTSQQLVSYWLNNGRALPAEYVLPAERAGFGSRHALRPDLYPVNDLAAVGPCPTCPRAAAGDIAACTAVACPMRQAELQAEVA